MGIEGIIASAFADLAKMENQGFCPRLKKPIAQPKRNASPAKRKNPQAEKVIGWGSYPGQPITMRRAALERRSNLTRPEYARLQPARKSFQTHPYCKLNTTLKASGNFQSPNGCTRSAPLAS
jgi:hypothetical protein